MPSIQGVPGSILRRGRKKKSQGTQNIKENKDFKPNAAYKKVKENEDKEIHSVWQL